MLVDTCIVPIQATRAALQLLILGFFFAIWYGPGDRRKSWLFWVLAFLFESTATLCGIFKMPMSLTALFWGLWLLSMVVAFSLWVDQAWPSPWRYGIVVALLVLGSLQHGAWWLSPPRWLFLICMALFLATIYNRVGGILLAVVGIWAGIGQSLLLPIVESGLPLDPIVLSLSIGLAQFTMMFWIALLYMCTIKRERDEYERSLEEANVLRSLAVRVQANDITTIDQVPTSRRAQRDLIQVPRVVKLP